MLDFPFRAKFYYHLAIEILAEATQPPLQEKKMNSILRFSPSICDLFLFTPLIGFKLSILFNFTHEELQFKP